MSEITKAQREELAIKHGLRSSALRWAKGDTLEELEADIQELLTESPGFRLDPDAVRPRNVPPSRQPREALLDSDEPADDTPTHLSGDELDELATTGYLRTGEALAQEVYER